MFSAAPHSMPCDLLVRWKAYAKKANRRKVTRNSCLLSLVLRVLPSGSGETRNMRMWSQLGPKTQTPIQMRASSSIATDRQAGRG